MEFRQANSRDKEAWLEVRRTIWPHTSRAVHEREFEEPAEGQSPRSLVVVIDGSEPAAYMEGAIVTAADGGTEARIEGWYVLPNFRVAGIGAEMLRVAEAWFSSKGCSRVIAAAKMVNQADYQSYLTIDPAEQESMPIFRRKLLEDGTEA